MAHKNSAQFLIALNLLLLAFFPGLQPQSDLALGEMVGGLSPLTVHEPGRSAAGENPEKNDETDPIFQELSRSEIVGNLKKWIADDTNGEWNKTELEMIQEVLQDSFLAMADVGLDGQEMLEGYRFVRHNGEFVRDERGLVALVRHDKEEIVLSDSAFVRLDGFSIYHEIGHAVDRRLDRQLSRNFHAEVGTGGEGSQDEHVTRDGFWMRPISREEPQEATADAFALWVTENQADMRQPVFPGMPLGVEFEGINEAMEEALMMGGDLG